MGTENYSNIFDKADWLQGVKQFDASYYDTDKNVYVEAPSNLNHGNIANQVNQLNNVLIGRGTYKLPSGMFSPNVIIGRYCSISHFVNIGATNHHMDYLFTGDIENDFNIEDDNEDKYTNIGCDVWIGLSSTILAGAKIGHGACIGAGTIVKKEIPPYAIVAGNPAKIIRYRFSDEIIDDLLDLKWWTLQPEIIKKIPYKNIKDSISYLKEIKGK